MSLIKYLTICMLVVSVTDACRKLKYSFHSPKSKGSGAEVPLSPTPSTVSDLVRVFTVAVTVIWASPSFWHPRAQIPSDMGIPFQYGCRVFGIPRYPPPVPKTLVIWVSPKHASRILQEYGKSSKDGFPKIEMF